MVVHRLMLALLRRSCNVPVADAHASVYLGHAPFSSRPAKSPKRRTGTSDASGSSPTAITDSTRVKDSGGKGPMGRSPEVPLVRAIGRSRWIYEVQAEDYAMAAPHPVHVIIGRDEVDDTELWTSLLASEEDRSQV